MRKDFLDVFINSTDITRECENYLIEDVQHTLLSTDAIIVGFFKPINAVYIDLEVKNTNVSALDVSYWNGSVYVPMNIIDRTKGFTRSGHIEWPRNIDDQAGSTVEGKEQYWYKITSDTDMSLVEINGINLLFSSEDDMREEEPELASDARRFPTGRNTLVGYLQAAKREIIQELRSKGQVIYNDEQRLINVNIFDLNNYGELREAGKFLSLYKFLMNLSDEPDDIYYTKALRYKENYNLAFNVFNLSIDRNDNGKEEKSETISMTYGRIKRI